MLLTDGCFMVVMSVGLCTKNTRTLKIFYFYTLYLSVASILILLGVIYYYGYRAGFTHPNYGLIIPAGVGCLINAAIDVAIILTLKSEIIKMRNKQQFDFSKCLL